METSPHIATILALGKNPLSSDPRDSVEHAMAAAWSSGDHLDVAMNWGRLRSYDLNNHEQIPDGWSLPDIKRSQDGNPAMVAALAPLGSDRIIVVFNQGSVGTYRRGGAIQVDAPQQELSAYPIPHAVAVSKSGALIALARLDQTIILYRCDWGAAPPSTPACKAAPLGNVQGRALAISPDEKRIVVGDASGAVTIYDLDGKPLGDPKNLDDPINALGWANSATGSRLERPRARSRCSMPTLCNKIQLLRRSSAPAQSSRWTGTPTLLRWLSCATARRFASGMPIPAPPRIRHFNRRSDLRGIPTKSGA